MPRDLDTPLDLRNRCESKTATISCTGWSGFTFKGFMRKGDKVAPEK